jgi:hypothetical protein
MNALDGETDSREASRYFSNLHLENLPLKELVKRIAQANNMTEKQAALTLFAGMAAVALALIFYRRQP